MRDANLKLACSLLSVAALPSKSPLPELHSQIHIRMIISKGKLITTGND